MSEPAATNVRRILYFADPMCSWCWGFSPVIAEIRRACADGPSIRLCAGGLRAGETRPMDQKSKEYVRHHWQQVEATTGQSFDYAFFDREGFVYDTEMACRAAVAVRNLTPPLSLNYLAAMQRAFYAENRDVTREDVLAAIAQSVGIEAEAFTTVYRAPEVIEATRADFRLTHGLGISGFPTVVLQDDSELAALTVGYQPFDDLAATLYAWLEG
jgi:putative protein-disulfide isomerase